VGDVSKNPIDSAFNEYFKVEVLKWYWVARTIYRRADIEKTDRLQPGRWAEPRPSSGSVLMRCRVRAEAGITAAVGRFVYQKAFPDILSTVLLTVN
jgi:hypothetical protein